MYQSVKRALEKMLKEEGYSYLFTVIKNNIPVRIYYSSISLEYAAIFPATENFGFIAKWQTYPDTL